MLMTAVIQEKTLDALDRGLNSLPGYFSMAELRLDACAEVRSPHHVPALASIIGRHRATPLLLTLRPTDQGGQFTGNETTRLQTLLALARLQPAALDVEHSVPREWIRNIRQAAPDARLIISYHNFSETPQDLESILAEMQEKAPGATYKIATMAVSTLDALRMLVFCKNSPDKDRLIGICMGEAGESTRILAPVVHSGMCYCPLTSASAPGQLDAASLRDIYNAPALNHDTRIYGLLGDPVDHSAGHIFHNKLNAGNGENAVYVKWRVPAHDLPLAVPLLRQLGVQGLSITMPLKEHMLPLTDSNDGEVTRIGALNTVLVKDGLWQGRNTDAPGAIHALSSPVAGQTVAVLGAGGAGKAITHELLRQSARVLVLNRSHDKALATGGTPLPLEALATLNSHACCCVINTLPSDVPLPLSDASFTPGTVAMDISYGKPSLFLEKAAEAGCRCVQGTAMFNAQALLQRQLWGLASAE